MTRASLKRAIAFYALMICALLPIGAIAYWAAWNARPSGEVHFWPVSREQHHLFACQSVLKGTFAYRMDLETGELDSRLIGSKVISPSREKFGKFHNRMWLSNWLGNACSEFECVDLSTDLPTLFRKRHLKADEDSNHYRDTLVNNHIVCLTSENLESIDFASGVLTDSVPTNQNGTLVIESIDDTECFLMSEIGSNRERILYKLDQGQIREIARWSCYHGHLFRSGATTYLGSILTDGSTFEVRNASTGEVAARYDAKHDVELTERLQTIDSTIVGRATPRSYTDLFTGKAIPVPEDSLLIARDLIGGRMITMRRSNPPAVGWECIVLNDSNGQELNRFDVPRHRYVSENGRRPNAFLLREDQLVLCTDSFAISIYDLSSGKLVCDYDPFAWSERCSVVAVIAFGIWSLIWLVGSARLHTQGWFDIAVCSGLVVACCCVRIPYRMDVGLEYCVCFGIFGSWILATTFGMLFGRTRWSLRFQPLLVIVAMVVGVVVEFIGDPLWEPIGPTVDFLFGLILLLSIYVIALLPLRWCGYRIETKSEIPAANAQPLKKVTTAFSLRDLFVLTIVSACLFTVVRWLPAINWLQARPSDWKGITLLVGTIATASLIAMWIANQLRSWAVRSGVWLLVVLTFESLSMFDASGVFRRELLWSAAIASLFCFQAYRLRGWQFGRTSSSGPQFRP